MERVCGIIFRKTAACDEFCSNLLIWRFWPIERSGQCPLGPTTCLGSYCFVLLGKKSFLVTVDETIQVPSCSFCPVMHMNTIFWETNSLWKLSDKDEVAPRSLSKSILVVAKTRFDLCFMSAGGCAIDVPAVVLNPKMGMPSQDVAWLYNKSRFWLESQNCHISESGVWNSHISIHKY